MVLRLNRSKPFGKISPPYQRDEWDRPAVVEQDGHFFDTQDHEIVAGVPGPSPRQDDENGGRTSAKTPSEILAVIGTIPYSQLLLDAKEILGKSCPRSKAQIIDELRRVQRSGYRAVSAEQNGTATITATPSNGIDLAAWGRGKKSYLFAEVRKAIRTRFNTNVTTTRDAVSLLINEHVVAAAEARAD